MPILDQLTDVADLRGLSPAQLDALAAELRERLAKLGYDRALDKAFVDWAGAENLEERVDGVGSIDPVVLEALRKQSA